MIALFGICYLGFIFCAFSHPNIFGIHSKITIIHDSPLPAVVQTINLPVRLLQVELVGHR